MIIILLIWTSGIYLLWLKAHLTMRLRSRKAPSGDLKSIVELSEAIRADMDKLGKDVNDLTNDQIVKLSREQLRGGKIGYVLAVIPEHYSFRKGLSRWARREWGWIGLTVFHVTMLVACNLHYFRPAFWMFWTLISGLAILALLTGSTTRSRVSLTVCSYLISLIVYGILAMPQR
jgi:hypothetical protein